MRQCGRVLNGRASIGEYTFAREYRGKSSYRPGACVPALELTRYNKCVTYSIVLVNNSNSLFLLADCYMESIKGKL